MISYDKGKVCTRLKNLRESRGWKLKDMAKQLDELIGYDALGIMKLDGDTGKQTVSQLEKNRKITIEVAFAYAKIFGVSLDYILGRSDDWQPGNRDVKELTGLSDGAIKSIENFNDIEKKNLNALLEDEKSKEFFNKIAYYNWMYKDREDRRKQARALDDYLLRQYGNQHPEQEGDQIEGHVDLIDFAKFECSQKFIAILENIVEKEAPNGNIKKEDS